jgi:hypothetical protein
MDSRQLAFLSLLVGFEALPNLRALFTQSVDKILQWSIIDMYIMPMYFIIMGLLLIFNKVNNEKFIVWPLFAFLAYRGFIKKYLL